MGSDRVLMTAGSERPMIGAARLGQVPADLDAIDEDENDQNISPVKSRRGGPHRRNRGDMDDISVRSEEHHSPAKGAINLAESHSSSFGGDLMIRPKPVVDLERSPHCTPRQSETKSAINLSA